MSEAPPEETTGLLRLVAITTLLLLISACAATFDSPSCYEEKRGKGANRALVAVPCPPEHG
ncbi:MAG TPA: hypothetical protein VED46_04515 [Alphaproteobacteria bacterium]|nr:hypothetical protein [Alphaproteobacteria bacterium]